MRGPMNGKARAKLITELDKEGRWFQKAVRHYRNREWARDMRRALGIGLAFLVDETQVSRATLNVAERREESGAITIGELEALAEAMECKLVYAIVPERGTVAELAERRKEHPRKPRTEREKEEQGYRDQYAQEVERIRMQDPRNWTAEEWRKEQGMEKENTKERGIEWTGIDGRGPVRRVHSAGVQKLMDDIASNHGGAVGKVKRDAAERGKGAGSRE